MSAGSALVRSASERLSSLRSLMSAARLAAYIIPTSDPHNSEYVCNAHKRREFISSFTGSSGTAVVTQSDARLWTDGRYFLQAERELDAACWKLMRVRKFWWAFGCSLVCVQWDSASSPSADCPRSPLLA